MKEPQNNDYFPLSEYKDRITRLREEMRNEKMDAVLLSTEINVTYFTGFLSGYWFITRYDDVQLALITVNPKDEPILFLPDNMEQTARTSCINDIRSWSQFSSGKDKGAIATVAEGFAELRLKKARVGLETGPHDRPGMSQSFFKDLQGSLHEVEWVNCSDMLRRIRMVKSPLEIEKLRVACNITCQAFKTGLDSLREGMSEKELGQIIAIEMAKLSTDVCVNHPWILYIHSDGRGASAYDGIPTNYRLCKGDTVYIDGGFIYQGYPADIIRCAVIGSPTKEQEQLYYASRDANMTALRHIRPGLKCKDLYKTWANAVCELGFEHILKDQLYANWDFLGHGVGLEVHEPPIINSTCEEILKPNMIISLEGSVFDKFPFSKTTISLKNEENILVTETGYEWLTPLSNDLWIVKK